MFVGLLLILFDKSKYRLKTIVIIVVSLWQVSLISSLIPSLTSTAAGAFRLTPLFFQIIDVDKADL